ncbi:MAG: hypothetical protein WA240_05615 [Nitrospirota bacterium]
MCDRNIITSNGEKLYLAAFELFSGQYGQIFYKAFYARNEEKLQKEVHKYLRDYYDRGNVTEIDGDVYCYFDGEVAVKQHGWEEITNLEQIVNRLL